MLVNLSGEDAVGGDGPRKGVFSPSYEKFKGLGIFKGHPFLHDISLL